MNWLGFGFGTILFYSLFNFFLKISSGKVNAGVASFIVDAIATFALAIYVLYLRIHGEKVFDIKPLSLIYLLFAAIAVALGNIFIYKMYSTGANLSVTTPFVQIGSIVVGTLLGIVFLKEGITIKYIIGLCASLLGLYLIITSK